MRVPAQTDAGDDPREHTALLGSCQAHFPLSEAEEDEDHARQVASWKTLPWWKRPSPYWIIFGIPFGSFGYSATLAPKVALYTILACRVHKPELATNDLPLLSFPPTTDRVTTGHADSPIHHVSGGETAVDTAFVFLPNSTYTASLDYSQNDADPQQTCASDPVVQATVARLTAVFTTCMGILTCLTTGWWGSLSDRHGRRIVLFTSMFGLFATDATHIITAWFVDVLPGGYWFPLVGSLIEGLCGSMSTALAMNNAYLADTTDPSTRSRYFSLSLGFMFAGVAVGPVLGSLLIRSTGNLLSVFYFACALHGIYSVLILFILPESLTRARVRGARLRQNQEKANQAPGGRVVGVLKRFLSPLAIFLPERPLDENPLVQKRRDWSLFFIAIAYGLNTSIMGSIPYKFQYAAAQFHWTPEITNYFVSWVGVTRSLFLAVLLPLVIKYLKPAPIQLPAEPLEGAAGRPPSPGARSLPDSDAPASRSPAFDLALARVSVVLDATSFVGMALASTGALYTLSATVGSFAAGFPPAVQALALDIYARQRADYSRGDVGKLLGALNVIQALASQIASPAMYGFVYAHTVAVVPQAIMVVSACSSVLALVFISLVRVRGVADVGDRPGNGNEHVERA